MPCFLQERIMTDLKTLLRTAQRVREAWEARATRADSGAQLLLDRLSEHQQALQQARRRVDLAREHGFSHVLPVLRDIVLAHAESLHRATAGALDAMAAPAP